MSNAVQAPCCPQVAERTITADLESLISKAVNPEKADYAVSDWCFTPVAPSYKDCLLGSF